VLTPTTDDPAVAARWLERFQGAGIDGVVVKDRAAPYSPGRRTMVKVKRERTAECVVAGLRAASVDPPLVGALLLGLHDDDGRLVHVGVASQFGKVARAELAARLRPLVRRLPGHPWENGFGLERSPIGRLSGSAGRWSPDMVQDWVPVAPELVCEVTYDTLDDRRLRYPARFVRWRPDRDPASCRFDQLEEARLDVHALLAG
jgi:ATP-dependent DNA ligase